MRKLLDDLLRALPHRDALTRIEAFAWFLVLIASLGFHFWTGTRWLEIITSVWPRSSDVYSPYQEAADQSVSLDFLLFFAAFSALLFQRVTRSSLLVWAVWPKSPAVESVTRDLNAAIAALTRRAKMHQAAARFHIVALIAAMIAGVTALISLEINSTRNDERAAESAAELREISNALTTITARDMKVATFAKMPAVQMTRAMSELAKEVCAGEVTPTGTILQKCQDYTGAAGEMRVGGFWLASSVQAFDSLTTTLGNSNQFDRLTQLIETSRETIADVYQKETFNINVVLRTLLSRLSIVGLTFSAIYVFGNLYRYNMAMAAKYSAVVDAATLKTQPEKLSDKGLEELIPSVSAAQDDLFRGKQLIEHFTEIFGKVIDRYGSPGNK